MTEREQFEVEFVKLNYQWSDANKDKAFLGWQMARAQPAQAEAVPVVDRVYEAAKRLVDHADFQLGGVLSAKSKARDIPSNAASKVKARHLASLRDALAKTPHQAEAVPSDVVRDAELGRQMREAIGNEALTRFIEKHGEPVPLQQRIGELEAALKLAYEALKQSHNHRMFAEACGAVTVFDSRSVRDCIEAIEKACAAIAAQGEKP